MCLGAVKDFGGLTAARFMLGVFEAGLAPGLAYYVSFWYRANERSIRLAFIYSTATLAGAFGTALEQCMSYATLTSQADSSLMGSLTSTRNPACQDGDGVSGNLPLG